MDASEAELKKLGDTAGVDFIALKNKYAGMSYSTKTDGMNGTKSVSESKLSAEEIKEAHERLDAFKICPACNGLGYTKEIYNHQVKEKECKECDGESIIMNNVVKKEGGKV